MPYDPTLPANNAPIVAAELRNQFAGLKDLLDLKPDFGQMEADSAGAVLAVNYLNLTVSNPPTQAEMQSLADKLDEILTFLRRE